MATKKKRFAAFNCPACKIKLWLRNLAGVVIWTNVDGRKTYDGQCPKCLKQYDIDVGRAPA